MTDHGNDSIWTDSTAEKGLLTVPEIQCTGADNVERTFSYQLQHDELDNVWRCSVLAVPPVAGAPAFEMTFEPLDEDEDTIRQVGVFNHGVQAHSAKGIPDAVLPAIANVLHKRVVSSPAQAPGAGVYRTVDAEKMWLRLQAKGIAEFDDDEEVYFIDPD